MTLSVRSALHWAEKKLTSLDTARLDAELLLANVLEKPRSFVLAYTEHLLSSAQWMQYQAMIEQRASQMPLAYLLGEKEFWSLCFQVNPEVLIPRPETELLVELLLEDCPNQAPRTVIDLGTGSGAIAVALAHARPDWNIFASDYSQAALRVAQKNAMHLLQSNTITFLLSDWLSDFPTMQAEIIVSNPPYLSISDPHLIDSEISHEPKSALVAADDGFADYKKIISQARSYLVAGGRVYLEHGAEQADKIAELLCQEGFSNIKNFRDLSGLPRVTRAEKSTHRHTAAPDSNPRGRL